MSSEKKPSEENAEAKSGEPESKPKGKEPYVSKFKKPGRGAFGSQGPASGGKSGYRGPTGPGAGGIRPRGGNRGS